MIKNKMLRKREAFKPFEYNWAWEKQDKQIKMHWVPYEINMDLDLSEFNKDLNERERIIVDKVCRFFTQVEIEVGRGYIEYFLQAFKVHEIRIMLLSFANMEGIHSLAYSYLLTSLRLPDEEYAEFMQMKEMREQADFLKKLKIDSPHDIAVAIATMGGFVEGFELFGSFAVLLYFSRARDKNPNLKNCLRGVGQVVEYTMRDETLHCEGMIELFHHFVNENRDKIDMAKLKRDVVASGEELLRQELAFIDFVFGGEDLDHLKCEDVKTHMKYLFDIRLAQLGFDPIYHVKKTPLWWMEVVAQEKTNFFETPGASTEYTIGSIKKDVTIDWTSIKKK